MTSRIRLLALALFLSLSVNSRAEDVDAAADSEPSPMIEAVDIPTSDILEPMTYSTAFRFYNQGGVMSRLVIGPLKRVNLGLSFDVERVIGSGEPHMIRPALFFKLRAFDGTDIFPALALGYDNQGFLYQDSISRYMHREKGIYIVGSHAILLPNLELHAGVNLYEFDEAKVFGFVGATFKITPSFALLAEYDNIRNGPDNRVNLGGRYWVAPYFNIDLAARNVGRDGDRGAERIVRLNYVGHFPI